ncbi:interleukin-1 receptor-associated kinase 1-like [Dorcoceras hygrometricum]|uniref:Interleukin-1 receptor-associated kinase 1-like n=1 Tax=Dorcoceras hygrometricum TaxID=472368 RepID=A0A2Z7CU71_9LAMI|nr:interleukin-1 receptor-associated kinase 1-like [Dorcoceras hygrometricum]
MAASLFVNSMQVDFESVLAMEHTGMVRMFKSLEETGLKGFLEASSSVFEGALTEIFMNTKKIGFSRPQVDLDADIKLKEVQTIVLSLEFKIASMDSRVISLDSKVVRIMVAQTFMKLDFGLCKLAFYEKMDTMVTNVTSSTNLVHQFTEHQMQIASDLDFVKMQLAEMVII